MDYLKAFLVGGAICMLGQLLIDKTRLTPARILVCYVVLGVILGVVAGNGIPEAAAALVLTPMVCVPLIRGLKLEPAPVPAQ